MSDCVQHNCSEMNLPLSQTLAARIIPGITVTGMNLIGLFACNNLKFLEREYTPSPLTYARPTTWILFGASPFRETQLPLIKHMHYMWHGIQNLFRNCLDFISNNIISRCTACTPITLSASIISFKVCSLKHSEFICQIYNDVFFHLESSLQDHFHFGE